MPSSPQQPFMATTPRGSSSTPRRRTWKTQHSAVTDGHVNSEDSKTKAATIVIPHRRQSIRRGHSNGGTPKRNNSEGSFGAWESDRRASFGTGMQELNARSTHSNDSNNVETSRVPSGTDVQTENSKRDLNSSNMGKGTETLQGSVQRSDHPAKPMPPSDGREVIRPSTATSKRTIRNMSVQNDANGDTPVATMRPRSAHVHRDGWIPAWRQSENRSPVSRPSSGRVRYTRDTKVVDSSDSDEGNVGNYDQRKEMLKKRPDSATNRAARAAVELTQALLDLAPSKRVGPWELCMPNVSEGQLSVAARAKGYGPAALLERDTDPILCLSPSELSGIQARRENIADMNNIGAAASLHLDPSCLTPVARLKRAILQPCDRLETLSANLPLDESFPEGVDHEHSDEEPMGRGQPNSRTSPTSKSKPSNVNVSEIIRDAWNVSATNTPKSVFASKESEGKPPQPMSITIPSKPKLLKIDSRAFMSPARAHAMTVAAAAVATGGRGLHGDGGGAPTPVQLRSEHISDFRSSHSGQSDDGNASSIDHGDDSADSDDESDEQKTVNNSTDSTSVPSSAKGWKSVKHHNTVLRSANLVVGLQQDAILTRALKRGVNPAVARAQALQRGIDHIPTHEWETGATIVEVPPEVPFNRFPFPKPDASRRVVAKMLGKCLSEMPAKYSVGGSTMTGSFVPDGKQGQSSRPSTAGIYRSRPSTATTRPSTARTESTESGRGLHTFRETRAAADAKLLQQRIKDERHRALDNLRSMPIVGERSDDRKTPVSVYERECLLAGVTPRLRAVTQRMEGMVRIGGTTLGGRQGAIALAKSLGVGQSVLRLKIMNNCLDQATIPHLVEAIPRLTELIELDLHENQKLGAMIRLGPLKHSEENEMAVESIRSWVVGMGSLHLKTLNLGKVQIGDLGIAAMLNGIYNGDCKYSLEFLDLQDNYMAEESATWLAGLLRDGRFRLEYLDISWNHIKGSKSPNLVEAMRSNKHLRVLNCAWNSLGGDDNADYWAFVIEDHPTLVDIDLSHNGLVDQNVFCILESLRVSGPVQRVNLVGNIARGLSGTSAQPFIRPPPPFLFTVTDDIDNDPITWDFCFAGRTKRRETVLNLHVPFERTVLRHMYRIACRKTKEALTHRCFTNTFYHLAGQFRKKRQLVIPEDNAWIVPVEGVVYLTYIFVGDDNDPARGFHEVLSVSWFDAKWGDCYYNLYNAVSGLLDGFPNCSSLLIEDTISITVWRHSQMIGLPFSLKHIKKALKKDDPHRVIHVNMVGRHTKPHEVVKDAQRSLSQLFYFRPHNPSGQYLLDLAAPIDIALFKYIFHLAKASQLIRRGLQLQDTSQRKNMMCIRNWHIDGREMEDEEIPDTWSDVPTEGILRFDYSATWRPSPQEQEATLAIWAVKELQAAASEKSLPELSRVIFLRHQLSRFYISTQQLWDLMQHFQEPVARVELAVAAFSRIGEIKTFWSEGKSIMSHDEFQTAVLRIGLMNCWTPMKPDGFFSLNAQYKDERWIGSVLVTLDNFESPKHKTNWTWKKPMWNLEPLGPRPANWSKQFPHKGLLHVTYNSKQKSVEPHRKLRREFGEDVLPFTRTLANNFNETIIIVERLVQDTFPGAGACDQRIAGEKDEDDSEEEEEEKEEEDNDGDGDEFPDNDMDVFDADLDAHGHCHSPTSPGSPTTGTEGGAVQRRPRRVSTFVRTPTVPLSAPLPTTTAPLSSSPPNGPMDATAPVSIPDHQKSVSVSVGSDGPKAQTDSTVIVAMDEIDGVVKEEEKHEVKPIHTGPGGSGSGAVTAMLAFVSTVGEKAANTKSGTTNSATSVGQQRGSQNKMGISSARALVRGDSSYKVGVNGGKATHGGGSSGGSGGGGGGGNERLNAARAKLQDLSGVSAQVKQGHDSNGKPVAANTTNVTAATMAFGVGGAPEGRTRRQAIM